MSVDRPFFTVSEITRKIKLLLEGGFPGIVVQGEVSNLRRHTSGHIYFTLKDEGAQIAAVIWRSRVPTLSLVPEDGMKVFATGRITLYELRGQYQLDISGIRPLGVGELQLAFERLKARLAEEGLFEERHKKPLPVFPERVGVVTSETGAALQDILNVLRRRFPGIAVILRSARVQGAGAAQEIAAAIQDLNEHGEADVMIVGRGGGSLEDLWAFNEEEVARAIFASRIPVVSAVGHEIDYTISDFVADRRAPTPSAAAELVVPDRRAVFERVVGFAARMSDAVRETLADRREAVRRALSSYALNRPLDLLRQYSQRLDDRTRAMRLSLRHVAGMAASRLEGLQARVSSMDPQLALKRGYAIVYRDGEAVGASAVLRPQDRIDVAFHDGVARSRVDSVEPR
jgi:exodeoxyribonuclease VII large subunit